MCDHWGCGYKWRQCSRGSSSKFVTMKNWACWHNAIFDWNSQEYSKLYMWFGVPGNSEIIHCRVLCCTPFRVSISSSYWLGTIIICEVVWSIVANWRLVVVSLNWFINTLKMELLHDLCTPLILYMDIHRQSLSIDRHPVSSVSVNSGSIKSSQTISDNENSESDFVCLSFMRLASTSKPFIDCR